MVFDFGKNTVVPKDKFESTVPTDFQGLYVEDGDNYKLDSDHPGVKAAISAITGQASALNSARKENKELKLKKDVDLSPLADYGDTPEVIASGITAAIEEATKAARKGDKGELERQVAKIKEDLSKGHATEIAAKDEVIGGLTGQLKTLLVDNAATKALSEAGAIDPDLVLPHISRHVQVNTDDGEFKVSVVDGAGDPRFSGTTGAPMSIGELVGEMKAQDKYAPLFKSEKKSGGGLDNKRRHGGGGTGGNEGDKTSHDKIKDGIAELTGG